MQVIGVHAVGHARAVGVPRHQVVHARALARRYVADRRRPQQVVGAQQLERAAHLAALEHAFLPHHRLEHRELRGADEDRQLARLAEIGLRGEHRHRREPVVVLLARASRRRSRAACRRCSSRRACTLRFGTTVLTASSAASTPSAQVVVHRDVAVLGRRVLPRDHEHRVAELGQVVHQRVLRRQVEDVVLHDPRRHDQHRLGVHRLRRAASTGSAPSAGCAGSPCPGSTRSARRPRSSRRRPGPGPFSVRCTSSARCFTPRTRLRPLLLASSADQLRVGRQVVVGGDAARGLRAP